MNAFKLTYSRMHVQTVLFRVFHASPVFLYECGPVGHLALDSNGDFAATLNCVSSRIPVGLEHVHMRVSNSSLVNNS